MPTYEPAQEEGSGHAWSGVVRLGRLGGLCLLALSSTGCFSWDVGSSGSGGAGVGGGSGGNVTNTGGAATTSSTTSTGGGGDSCVLDWGVDLSQVWAKRFGDEGGASDQPQEGYRVALDASGQAFVAGVYASPLDLGVGLLPQAGIGTQYSSPEGMFVGRFDANGAPKYSVGVVSTEYIEPTGLTARTGSASTFVFGQYLNQVDSWGLPDGAGNGAFFLAELNVTGGKDWAQPFTGPGYSTPGRIAYSSSTNALYATGTFQTSMTIGTSTLTGTTGPVGFLVRLNPDNGAVAWSKTFDCGPSCPVSAPSVAVDSGGVVYGLVSLPSTAGCTCDFDTGTVVPNGKKDVVLVGYDASGTPRGARTITGDELNSATDVATSGTDVFVLGSAKGSVTLEGAATPLSSQNLSAYLASYDTLGNLRFAKRLGGKTGLPASAMASDTFGRLWITGAASSDTTDLGCLEPFTPGASPSHPYLMAVDSTDGHTVLANFLNVGASGYVGIYGLAIQGKRIALTGSLQQSGGPAQVDFGGAPLTNTKNGDDVLAAVLEMP